MPRPLPPQVVAQAGGSEADAVRDHILDAAHRVIVSHGLAGASTRAIAAEAGVGAGTVYNYFDNRLQLLAQAILRRTHLLARPLDDLSTQAGKDNVSRNLRRFAGQAGAVLDEMVPLFAAAFSDTDLMQALRHELARGALSHDPAAPIESYLRAEQVLGRVAADADCRAAATTVVSLCHDRAFHLFLTGETPTRGSLTREIDLIARAVTR